MHETWNKWENSLSSLLPQHYNCRHTTINKETCSSSLSPSSGHFFLNNHAIGLVVQRSEKYSTWCVALADFEQCSLSKMNKPIYNSRICPDLPRDNCMKHFDFLNFETKYFLPPALLFGSALRMSDEATGRIPVRLARIRVFTYPSPSPFVLSTVVDERC